jgi:PAS domain-containing protein
VINLESTRPNAFNNEDLRFVQTIASHATLALQGSNLSETIDAQREQLQLLMNSTKDAVWLVSTDFKILDINPIASQLLGWPAKKVIGQYCSDIWPDNSGSGHRELGRFLEQAMAMGDRVSF